MGISDFTSGNSELSTVVSHTDKAVNETVIHSLLKNSLTLSTAESCTGGLVSKLLTDVAGSSQCFYGGMCVYTDEIKINVLGVSKSTIENYTAVSYETAAELADRIREKFNTDIGVGITGYAGPGGGTESDPVGTVYIAASSREKSICEVCHFNGSRAEVRIQAADYALNMVCRLVIQIKS